jgi:hypothetical protein
VGGFASFFSSVILRFIAPLVLFFFPPCLSCLSASFFGKVEVLAKKGQGQ